MPAQLSKQKQEQVVDVKPAQIQHKHPGQWRIPLAVAVLLILLCAAGGIWGIMRWMQNSAVSAEAIAVDPPRGGGGWRGGGEQAPGRILKRDDGSIRAFSGNYSLFVTKGQMTLFCGSGEQWLSRDQQLLFNMAQRYNRGATAMRNMQFTDQQKQQMKLIIAEPPLPLSEADKAKLSGLIKTWEEARDAAKAEAQRAVLVAVREVANANIPAAKEAFVANFNKLHSIITPQQLDQYRQLEMARRNGNRPAQPPRGA